MSPIAYGARTSVVASRDVRGAMLAPRDHRPSYALAMAIETRGSTSTRAGSQAVVTRDGPVLADWGAGGCVESTGCQGALVRLQPGRSPVPDIALIASRKPSRLALDCLRRRGLGESDFAGIRALADLKRDAAAPDEIARSVPGEIVMLRHSADDVPRSQKASWTENHA